jgi:hypothetical protein
MKNEAALIWRRRKSSAAYRRSGSAKIGAKAAAAWRQREIMKEMAKAKWRESNGMASKISANQKLASKRRM